MDDITEARLEELWEDHQQDRLDKHVSFLVYKGVRDSIFDLSDEEAGRLFKALFDYACERVETSFQDRLLRSLYREMAACIERDDRKYWERCKQNAKNAGKGRNGKGNGRNGE